MTVLMDRVSSLAATRKQKSVRSRKVRYVPTDPHSRGINTTTRAGRGVVRKQLMGVSIGELATVRLTCKCKKGDGTCGGIVELPVSSLDVQDHFHLPCPLCKNTLRQSGIDDIKNDPLAILAVAIAKIKAMQASYDFEFIIPDDQP